MNYLMLFIVLLVSTGCSTATPLKGLVTAQVADTMQVAENVKIMDNLNAKVAESMKFAEDIKATMLDMQNANIRLIDSLKLQIKLQLEASVKGIAGVNNKIDEVKQTAGRDALSNSGNTNDSDLMAKIVKYWYMLAIAIFTGLIALMKWQQVSQANNATSELNRVTVDKDFYKMRYIGEVCKDQADLEKLRTDKLENRQEKIAEKAV